MNNLAELVNSGSDGGKCIQYTPYDPTKDEGMSCLPIQKDPGENSVSVILSSSGMFVFLRRIKGKSTSGFIREKDARVPSAHRTTIPIAT